MINLKTRRKRLREEIQKNKSMKKAIIISLAEIVIVILIDKAISFYISRSFYIYKGITTSEVTNLAAKKYYCIGITNILFSIILFFFLKKLTTTSRRVILILCFSVLIVNRIMNYYNLV